MLNTSTISKHYTLNDVLFEFNSSELQSQAYSVLDSVFTLISNADSLEVHGYTDNVGTEEFNEQLSQDRANAVAEYYFGKGIREEAITIIGHGSNSPISPNDSAEGRSKNRRVEIVVW